MRSSVITRVLYDASSQTLAVTFNSGRTYLYEDVPADVAAAFQASESLGSYFNAHIRDEYYMRALD